MKSIAEMDQIECCAFVQSHLKRKGIEVVLSGGTSVAVHSIGKYISKDIDLINIYSVDRRKLREAMLEIGYQEEGRYFKHPDSQFIIEFPLGPLFVGQEPVQKIEEIEYPTGILKIISATDCVKDRLAAFFYWGDNQGFTQALLVAKQNDIDLEEIRRWSSSEGKSKEFELFKNSLLKI